MTSCRISSPWRELQSRTVFVTRDIDWRVYMSTRVVALTRSPGTVAIDPSGPRRQLTGERPKYWAGGGP
jgi:ABC-type nitrate/sulfonate/bicarbonate transport system ATPase subunit